MKKVEFEGDAIFGREAVKKLHLSGKKCNKKTALFTFLVEVQLKMANAFFSGLRKLIFIQIGINGFTQYPSYLEGYPIQ